MVAVVFEAADDVKLSWNFLMLKSWKRVGLSIHDIPPIFLNASTTMVTYTTMTNAKKSRELSMLPVALQLNCHRTFGLI